MTATNAAILDWNLDSGLPPSTSSLTANLSSSLTQFTVDDQGVLNDQTTVEITIGGTNDAPTITGEVVQHR